MYLLLFNNYEEAEAILKVFPKETKELTDSQLKYWRKILPSIGQKVIPYSPTPYCAIINDHLIFAGWDPIADLHKYLERAFNNKAYTLTELISSYPEVLI